MADSKFLSQKIRDKFWKTNYIICDTREQKPYVFTGNPVVVSTLRTGDYSVSGMENLVVVERKEQGDYWNCLVNRKGKDGSRDAMNRERFIRELERMREIPWALIVLECSLQQIREGYFYWNGVKNCRSLVNGGVALNSALHWMMAYPSVRFAFAGTRVDGEWLTLNWLRMALRYQRHRDKEARDATGL